MKIIAKLYEWIWLHIWLITMNEEKRPESWDIGTFEVLEEQNGD